MIAARVPQHRAALEDLIRHETGLELTFSELTVRWGWYGPEAVFHHVTLAETGAPTLLRASELVVSLDLWRSARSGHPEAGRIRLIAPDIQLPAGGARTPPATAAGATAAPLRAGPGLRLLARWRGGRIDVEGGTLRWTLPGNPHPLTFNIGHADLRRLGREWSGDARLLLPDSLGASAHVALRAQGDFAVAGDLQGTLTLEGERLSFAGWRGLGLYPDIERGLPEAGTGNVSAVLALAAGTVTDVHGDVHAQSLEWPALAEGEQTLKLARLRGAWTLARTSGEWRFSAPALDLGAAVPASATLSLDEAGDATRGTLRRMPLALLAGFAHWYAPQLPLADVALAGEVREFNFDWSGARPAGSRLKTSAQLADVRLGAPAHEAELSGLSVQLMGEDARVTLDLQGHAARLVLAREQEPFTLTGLELAARVLVAADDGGYRVTSDDVQIRRGDTRLAVSGAFGASAPGAAPQIDAHLGLRGADVTLLDSLLGPDGRLALGASATRLTAGRLASADFELHGAPQLLLHGRPSEAQLRGTLELRDATLAASDSFPEVQNLSARVDWRGARLHAQIASAASTGFQLQGASADWDAHGEHPVHLQGRLSGRAEEALDWLRAHPQLTEYAPGVADVDLRGDTLLDVDALVPPAQQQNAQPQVRVTAVLEGVQLVALAGLPPIEALRGTLALANGRLQHSLLSGRWLGGPVAIGVGERREHDERALAISARGLLDVRQALLAAGRNPEETPLAGSAEWSALVSLLPRTGTAPLRWRVRADTNLVGVASRLPEPLAKAANAPLPLHVELSGEGDAGELHASLAERLQAIGALTRTADAWRIERGAVRLAGAAPSLPENAVLTLEGRVGRLDLPAYLTLWREASRDATLPALEGRISASELVLNGRSYPEVTLEAHSSAQGAELVLASSALTAGFRWPTRADDAGAASAHLPRLDGEHLADLTEAVRFAAPLGSPLELQVDELRWQDRPLGRLSAVLSWQGTRLNATEVRLEGGNEELRGALDCQRDLCRAHFALDSRDAARTLALYGVRAELDAPRAQLSGDLEWSPQAPLASLGGSLHMQLEEGSTRLAAAQGSAPPLALLIVPALLQAAQLREERPEELHFTRLAADFDVRDGNAATQNLHFDGDAEILVRGHVGLAAGDYDVQAFVLHGGERLPSALRRLNPTPKMAALWLSLREWLSGAGGERPTAALRLRGTWDDPIVEAAE
jgi:uncharacterized protein YhdP